MQELVNVMNQTPIEIALGVDENVFGLHIIFLKHRKFESEYCNLTDPCPHTRDTTAETAGPGTVETGPMRPDHSRGPEATRTVTGSGETQGGGAHRQGDGLGDGDQDGVTARRPAEHFKERPSPGSGAHVSAGI